MKKLLFAIAGAAAFAAMASDPSPRQGSDIDVLGFENFDFTNPNTTNGVVGVGDNGLSGQTKWSCAGDDASTVKTYGGDNAAAPEGITFPAPFNGAGENYLALDTNGSELQRTVGATVDANGTYIDTLVQFTPSESAPTSTDLDGAKLAIWLGVDSEHNTTNLMVQGNYWDFDAAPQASSQVYTLTGKTIEPGTWYRLTVKAIANILNEDSTYCLPAFQIFVDGTEMVLSTSPISAGFAELLEQSNMYATPDLETAATANKLVPSIQAEIGTYGATVTLTSVGFKGTGALDDFVVTTEDPTFAPATLDFTLTLTLDSNVDSYTVTTNGATVAFVNGAAQIPSNTVVTIAAPTFASGYELDAFSVDGSPIASPVFPYAITMEANTTVGITSKVSAPAYPTYLDNADATVKAKYDTWKATYGADANSEYETAFLLNMDPATSVSAGTALLKIASITQVSGGWELEIASDATTLTATANNDGLVGNGYLAITYAADLATLASGGTTVNLPVAVTAGKITVTVTAEGAKFMKAKLSTTAESQSQN